MIANFSQELYKKLIQNGFNTIKGFYDNTTLDNNTRFLGLLKEEGASWYAVILTNMDNISMSEFNNANKDYTIFFKKLQKRYNVRSVFITNLMLSEKPTPIINSFISNLESFVDQPVNNIYWNVVIENGSIFLNESHPTQVLNLRKLIDDTYISVKPKIHNYNYGKNLNDLKETAYNESPYKQKEKVAYGTYAIILINLLVFILMELNGGSNNIQTLIRFGAIEPNAVIYQKEFYRLFTAMFLHVGFAHFAYNTLAIYIFGTRAEKYYGRFNFITIYILGGLVGSIFSLLFTRSVSAGASGAIFSVIGAITVITKLSKIDLEGLNYYTMVMYILIGAAANLTMDGIDNFGHLGGLIGGILIGYIICKISKKTGD